MLTFNKMYSALTMLTTCSGPDWFKQALFHIVALIVLALIVLAVQATFRP